MRSSPTVLSDMFPSTLKKKSGGVYCFRLVHLSARPYICYTFFSILLVFSLTVNAAHHDCVIRTGQP